MISREDLMRYGYQLISDESGKELWEINKERVTAELLETERAGLSDRDKWLINEIENYMQREGITFDELGEEYRKEYMFCLDRELRNLTE